jgi:hypothetical protein
MQQQALPLPQRLMATGHGLWAMDEALQAKDVQKVERLLQGRQRIVPLSPHELMQGHLDFGLEVARGMLKLLDERSVSIRSYGEAALEYFGSGLGSFERYARARAHFESALPKWDIWFEHMLVNHMFFSGFPFQDRPESLRDEFVALCAVYALLRGRILEALRYYAPLPIAAVLLAAADLRMLLFLKGRATLPSRRFGYACLFILVGTIVLQCILRNALLLFGIDYVGDILK